MQPDVIIDTSHVDALILERNAATVVAYAFCHPDCFSYWNLQDCMYFQGMESSASWVERNTFWMWQRSLWGRKSTMTSSSNAQSGSIRWATWTTKSTLTWCSTRWVTQKSIIKTCTCDRGYRKIDALIILMMKCDQRDSQNIYNSLH